MCEDTVFDPLTWQPIRLPYNANSKPDSRPLLSIFGNREAADMHAWIEKNCEGEWRHELDESRNSVFWFEQKSDAMEFAMMWFPYKCM